MPRKRPSKNKKPQEIQASQTDASKANDDLLQGKMIDKLDNIDSLLGHNDSKKPGPSKDNKTLHENTAALHDELDVFRQRWKRELETKTVDPSQTDITVSSVTSKQEGAEKSRLESVEANNRSAITQDTTIKDPITLKSNQDPQDTYKLAKELFLIGVKLEQDELHNESIRYYKQAIHLCPNIEKQIFREQLESSARANRENRLGRSDGAENSDPNHQRTNVDEAEIVPILDRVRERHIEDNKEGKFTFCRPAHKLKSQTVHISQLPRDLILKICNHVIGQELDLVSLEQFGMVCRGFFLISNDPSLWRSICYRTWSANSFNKETRAPYLIDWRRVYIEKPKVNCDGVYISKTRYIRQGDVGFQDLTYRPFHLIRYFRYLRFFPDRRVLILTTNEEPERIKPIFRNALNSKHFSPELSVLEGIYEFIEPNQVVIVAEKDFYDENQVQQPNNNRRQARFHWSRQTPLNQKFSMKFELKTYENRPYKNNVLKWREYNIATTFETGTEVTEFDLSPDTFPGLGFTRI